MAALNSPSERCAMADRLIARAKQLRNTEVFGRLGFLKHMLENYGLDDPSSIAVMCVDLEKTVYTEAVLSCSDCYLMQAQVLLDHDLACTRAHNQCSSCENNSQCNAEIYDVFKKALNLFAEEVPTRGHGEGPSGVNV